jgi:hypothetical protein
MGLIVECSNTTQIYYETKGTFLEWGEMYPNHLVDYTWSKPQGDPFMKQKFKGQLVEHVKMKDDILVLGCGNSVLSEYLRVAGWKGSITSVDFSEECVFQCKKSGGHGQDHALMCLGIPPMSAFVVCKRDLADRWFCACLLQDTSKVFFSECLNKQYILSIDFYVTTFFLCLLRLLI